MAEGSIWEAFENAAFTGLDNLIAIIDMNRLGQTGETMLGWDLDAYASRAEAFGWHAIEIDGHDVAAIDAAYTEARETTGRPTVIVARTKKGKGVTAVEDQPGKHGKPLEDPDAAIEELGGERDLTSRSRRPTTAAASRTLRRPRRRAADLGRSARRSRPARPTARRSPRSARRDGDVVALDGEVSNSTYAEMFREAHPDRFFEMYIAEQQMVAAAVGMQVRGWKPFASTFAAFFWRAYDFVRMAAISRASIRLCGSHAGVSIGEDGPSQMALEDLAMMRAVHGSTVLYPCDANQTAQLSPRWPTAGHLLPAHPAREDRRCSRRPARRCRSAAAGSPSRATTSPSSPRHHPARGDQGGRQLAAEGVKCASSISTRSSRSTPKRSTRRPARRRDRRRRGSLARGRSRRGGARRPRRGERPAAGPQARGPRAAAVGHARRASAAAGIDAEAIVDAAKQLAKAGSPA